MYQGSGSDVLSRNSPKNLDSLAVWSIPFAWHWRARVRCFTGLC